MELFLAMLALLGFIFLGGIAAAALLYAAVRISERSAAKARRDGLCAPACRGGCPKGVLCRAAGAPERFDPFL